MMTRACFVLAFLMLWTAGLSGSPLGYAQVESATQEDMIAQLQKIVSRIESEIGGQIVHVQAQAGETCHGTVIFLAADGADQVFSGQGIGFLKEDIQVEITTFTRPELAPAMPEATCFTFSFPAGTDPMPFLERWELLSIRFRAGEWLFRYHADAPSRPADQRILAKHRIRLLAGNTDEKRVVLDETFSSRRPPEEMQLVDPAESKATSPEPQDRRPLSGI